MEHSKYADKTSRTDSKGSADFPRIAVMGIGNLLLRDEGIGIHVIHKLRDMVDANTVEIIDAGTVPDIFSLVPQNIEKLILIDAAAGNDDPGTIYRMKLSDITTDSSAPVSLHNMGLAENVYMLSLLNQNIKSVIILGVQAEDIGFGLEPTAEIRKRIPQVIQMILTEIHRED